ncbi:Mitochondrial import receptor subunit TOM40B [Phytophthora pseudosyringae]|uniref:Mitochondrial import receptor subunit TOM40B n=1 Tax=Phytophthora pseudosyringae TaxID=221518 RepID=A0A8T1W814_9STRA|nr:Mitochondrial import receptor subunit TOM40B [Phytophthora pseudosyringae]
MGGAPSKSERPASKRYPVLATSASPEEGDLPVYMQQVEQIEKERAKLPNPGLYENAPNELKGPVSPDAFDGFRFDFTRILGQSCSTSHSFLLGTPMIPGGLYQFGANVVMGDPMDPSTFLMSKITPDGYLDARWNQKLSDKWKMRVKSQLKNEEHGSQALADFDYAGEDFTWNMKISNGPLLGASYLQSVTQKLALGGEVYYHGKHRKVISAYAGKWTDRDWVGMATYGAMGTLQLAYLRKVGHRLRYGSELVYNHESGEAQTTCGVEMDLGQTRFVSSVDSTFRVATSIESRVLPNFVLTLSAEGFPLKDDFKFGYGAQLSF